MNIQILVAIDKLNNHEFQHTAELFDAGAVDIKLLNKIRDCLLAESKRALLGQQHHVDGLENDLLHAREVEILDDQFCAVLDVDAQMNFFFVVVLNSENEAEIKCIFVSVLFEKMDQVVEDSWVENLDVLDYENYRLEFGETSTFHDVLYPNECLLDKGLIELIFTCGSINSLV